MKVKCDMSAAARCKTCSVCGGDLKEDDRTNIEPILEIGYPVRYVATCWHHSSYPIRKAREILVSYEVNLLVLEEE